MSIKDLKQEIKIISEKIKTLNAKLRIEKNTLKEAIKNRKSDSKKIKNDIKIMKAIEKDMKLHKKLKEEDYFPENDEKKLIELKNSINSTISDEKKELYSKIDNGDFDKIIKSIEKEILELMEYRNEINERINIISTSSH